MLRLTTCTSCVEVCLVSTRSLKFNIMNLKYLFGLATLGIVAVACNDINDNIPVNIRPIYYLFSQEEINLQHALTAWQINGRREMLLVFLC